MAKSSCCNVELNYFSDYGFECVYCPKCNKAYDIETNEEIQEGGELDDDQSEIS